MPPRQHCQNYEVGKHQNDGHRSYDKKQHLILDGINFRQIHPDNKRSPLFSIHADRCAYVPESLTRIALIQLLDGAVSIIRKYSLDALVCVEISFGSAVYDV